MDRVSTFVPSCTKLKGGWEGKGERGNGKNSRLVVVVKVIVRNRHPLRGVRHVAQPVVVVLVVVHVRVELVVVDPDVTRGLDADGVAVFGQHLADLQVADDDVLDPLDVQRYAHQRRLAVDAEDRRVGAWVYFCGAADFARDVDYFGCGVVFLYGGGELGEGGDGGGCAALATGGAESGLEVVLCVLCMPWSRLARLVV